MAQADMPNPIELYEAARDYMVPIIGGVKAPQLTDSTPCSEWNVQQLINHNLKVAEWANSILTGGPAVDDLSVNDPSIRSIIPLSLCNHFSTNPEKLRP